MEQFRLTCGFASGCYLCKMEIKYVLTIVNQRFVKTILISLFMKLNKTIDEIVLREVVISGKYYNC